MPPFDLNFIKRPAIGLGRRIGQGFEYLRDGLDPDADPAELEQVRRALPPSFNGTQNPATQPRPVLPNPNAPMTSDQPPAAINTRPRTVTPQEDVAPAAPATRPRIADPVNAAEYDYVGEHGKRSAKEIALGALYGLGTGGLPGAIGGALGQTIAPEYAAQNRFRQFERPRLLEDQKYQRDNELYGFKRDQAAYGVEKERLQGENYRNQIEMRGAENERQNRELTARVPYWEAQAKAEEAQAKLRDAQAKAALRGTAVTIDVDEGNGKINTYRVFPNGDKQLVGPSAEAHYKREQNKTSMRNTDARNQTSARNTDRRIAAGGATKQKDTYITDDDIQGVADDQGISFDEALRGLLNEGYKRTPNQRGY